MPDPNHGEANVKRACWIDADDFGEDPPDCSDPLCFVQPLESEIGWTHSLATSIYSTSVMTPTWLKGECETEGLVWGRHCILIEKFVPRETLAKTIAFVEDYCKRSAGHPDYVRAQLAQLGHWEFEDIDSGLPGRRRWHISARLLNLQSPDIDLEEFSPAEGQDFGIRIRAGIGAEGGDDVGDERETFEFMLCTPNWLVEKRGMKEMKLCNGIAFMQRFDLEVMRRVVRETCAKLKGYTAAEAIGKMARYAAPISSSAK